MAFTQKPINTLTKEELIENIKILKSGEDFPNKDKIGNIDTLIDFHISELQDRFHYDYEAVKEQKIKTWIDDIFNWGEKGASIVSKLKGGASVNVDGDKYDIEPGDNANEDANDKKVRNVLIGIGVFITITIGLLIYLRNANKSR